MNIITKLNIRQKIMLALTLLAAIFLIWQIYNFVHGDAVPQNQTAISSPNVSAAAKASEDTAQGSAPPKVIRELPSAEANPALINEQRQYLEMVRQYQITKMKRQILEEQAAVASAQKRISEAGLSSDYSKLNAFSGPAVVSGGYQLSYIDRQAGQWLATISENGQYHEVRVGSHLADGSRVVSINSDKVVLSRQHGKNWELKFPGDANVNESFSIKSSDTAVARIRKSLIQTKVKPTQSNAKIAKILGITTAPGQESIPTTDPVGVAVAPTISKIPEQAPVEAPAVLPPPVASVSTQQQPAEPQPNLPATTDIPAAPMIEAPVAAAPSVPEKIESPAPAPSLESAPAAEATPSFPDNSPIAGKPVTVKELREHNAAQSNVPAPMALKTEESNQETPEFNQISWQQAADLQAAVMNDR